MHGARPLWIIGDPHAGTDAAADGALIDLLRRAADRRADVIVMGDLFVAWLGPERFWPADHRPILEALRSVRAAGGRTRLVVGNRDYLAGALAGDVFDDVYARPALVDLGGRPTWLLHGDGIVPEDRAYRAWRALTRSPIVSAALARLPAVWGTRLPEWTARRLRTTNRVFKTGDVPPSGLAAVAREAQRAGAHRCVMGHFHTPMQREIDGIEIIVAPGWLEHRVFLEVDGVDLRRRGLADVSARP